MPPIDRRSLLKNVPLALAGMTAAPLLMRTPQAAAAMPAGQADAYGKWSTVTYMPVEYQLQHQLNIATIQDTRYAPFFDTNMSVPSDAARSLLTGQLDASQALTPSAENLNLLFDPSYKTPDNGYAVLDGQMAYAQSRTIMPGITTDMFKWWFAWHPLEKERYMLWFPQAHIDTSVEDPTRLRDTSLSYEKRLYNNPNRIQEWIGPNALDSIIHFSEPADLGFDPQLMRLAGFTASASAICYSTAEPDIPFTLMVHIARDTNAGLELISRYWIGAHRDMARFNNADKTAAMLQRMGFNEQLLESMAYELSVHDMTEFHHLARILPSLYQAFA
jgi:hypothetical protein